MPVYQIYNDTGEEGISGSDMLDGDIGKVQPEGYEFAAPTYSVILSDGTIIRKGSITVGLRIDPTFLPTKIRWGGRKRELTDLQYARGSMLVRDNFRQVVESLEPGLHQFEPVDIIWKDGASAGQFFWFYPCARLDGMDRELTTHTLHRERVWDEVSGGKYVICLKQVSGHHVWFDKRAMWHFPFVSDEFKEAMTHAGVNGIGYYEREAV
jgi:hypothetical protein